MESVLQNSDQLPPGATKGKFQKFFWNFLYEKLILKLIKSKTTKPEMRQEAALNLSELLEQGIGRKINPKA